MDPGASDLAVHGNWNSEIARNIIVHQEWFVVNENASAIPLGYKYQRLIDPEDLDYSQADRSPKFTSWRIEMPGVGLVLLGLWILTGIHRFIVIQILQVMLDTLAIMLVFWITLQLYRRPRAALLAAAGYALCVPIVLLIRAPLHDTWAVFATLGVVGLYVRSLYSQRWLRWLVAEGLVAGVGLWFRPMVIMTSLALGIATVAWRGWREALVRIVLPCSIALLVLSPYSLWTTQEGHGFTPANVGFGQVLWEGLGQRQNDFGAFFDDYKTYQQVRAVRPDLEFEMPAYDNYLRAKAVQAILDHPQFYLTLVGQRVIDGLGPIQRPGGRMGPVTAIIAPLFFLAAVFGFALGWRQYRHQQLLMISVITGVFIVPVLLAMSYRYVAPTTFVFLIFCGLTGDRIIDWIRR
jgi:4-amino-4-deoxy-L-arabinose transferase-like glycosyltransferase